MKVLILGILLALSVVPASAQQPQPQETVEQRISQQIGSCVLQATSLSLERDNLRQQLKSASDQLAALQKELDELKGKK